MNGPILVVRVPEGVMGDGNLPADYKPPLFVPGPPPKTPVKDMMIYVLVGILAAIVGWMACEWKNFQLQAQLKSGVGPNDNGLTLPAEIELRAGEPPRILEAQTSGVFVKWQSLDKELIVSERDAKSCSVWSVTPGTWRIQATSAVGGMTTGFTTCLVRVTEGKKP